MKTEGFHIIIDFWDCDPVILNDEGFLKDALKEAAQAAGATVMNVQSQKFEDQGLTAFAILAESHISIHTWPEEQYAGVDIYTCGDCNSMRAYQYLKNKIASQKANFTRISRGEKSQNPSIVESKEQQLHQSSIQREDNWYFEDGVHGKRQKNVSHGFRVSKLLLHETSKYQEYMVFDNPAFGRVLVLDGIVQLSTYDEHIYHEMLVHPPMFLHPKPKRILIVGGGDGGTLREVLKHNPDEVIMIDIDEQFVRSIEPLFPTINAGAFDDPRVTLLFEDASLALKGFEDTFDVAIIDCNNESGPSEALFSEAFYSLISNSLRKGGICSAQAGSLLDTEPLENMRSLMLRQIGLTTGHRITIPIYNCGEYMFFVSSTGSDPKATDISTLEERQSMRGVETKHWSPEIHHSTQLLPPNSTLR